MEKLMKMTDEIGRFVQEMNRILKLHQNAGNRRVRRYDRVI